MLFLRYDKYEGTPFRDGEVETYVEAFIERIHSHDIRISYATENILYAVRTAVAEGRLQPFNVVVEWQPYDDALNPLPIQTLAIDSTGTFDRWPRGFADVTEGYLMRLLNWATDENGLQIGPDSEGIIVP